MQYFDQTDDKPKKIGKALGDAMAVVLIVGLFIIFTMSMLGH
jgi:hypothetical protein